MIQKRINLERCFPNGVWVPNAIKQVKATSQKFLWKKIAKVLSTSVFFLKLWVPCCPWRWTSAIWPWCGHPFLGKSKKNLRTLQPLRTLSEAVEQFHTGRAFYGLNWESLDLSSSTRNSSWNSEGPISCCNRPGQWQPQVQWELSVSFSLFYRETKNATAISWAGYNHTELNRQMFFKC